MPANFLNLARCAFLKTGLTVVCAVCFFSSQSLGQDLAPIEDPSIPNYSAPGNQSLQPNRLDLDDSIVTPTFGSHSGSPSTLFGWLDGQRGSLNLDDGIVTDRPDFTEASSTVGNGVLQFEIGYTYTYDNDTANQTISHSFPETLMRYGIFADWLEFRLGSNFAVEDINNVRNSGAEDIYLGFKLGLTPQKGILPEMALIPQMTVPSGSNAFSSDKVLPGLNWIYGWEISERISTAGSTQFNRAIDDNTTNEYSEWAQSWTVAYGLTEKWGMYTEWFAFFPQDADTMQNEHYFNGGFTRAIGNNVQWDIRAGMGLNSAADDYFIGTGLSMRFNNRCCN